MKIVYCADSIRGIGGIQRVTVAKVNALADLPGNRVWILVADTSGEQIFELSPKVKVTDLCVNYYEDDWKSRWHVLKGILLKRRLHKRKVKEALEEINPDVVVSVGESEKYFLAGLKGGWLKVREIHFYKHYRCLAAGTPGARAIARLSEAYDFGWKIRRYDRIVVLTEEDRKNNWRNCNKVRVIPNPLPFTRDRVSPLNEKCIVAVGRLTAQKNFISLLRAFRPVADRFPEWHLEIIGDGGDRKMLADEVERLSLGDNVMLRGAVKDVRERLLSASCLVSSSVFEGFGMALTEAMSCGLPVVSYSCPTGPSEIITDGVDGFLVAPGDEKALAERICTIIENEDLRKKMGAAAFRSSARYDIDRIVSMWMNLFEGKC